MLEEINAKQMLKPFLKNIQNYIKGSLDFLNKCQRETKDEFVISIFDVVRLYSIILNILGLHALNFLLINFSSDLYPRFPRLFIIADFALKDNLLIFASICYLQT